MFDSVAKQIHVWLYENKEPNETVRAIIDGMDDTPVNMHLRGTKMSVTV